jgi:hypothetical protein
LLLFAIVIVLIVNIYLYLLYTNSSRQLYKMDPDTISDKF